MSVVDYNTIAEELPYNLDEVDEGLNEKMFIWIFIKVSYKRSKVFFALICSKNDNTLS